MVFTRTASGGTKVEYDADFGFKGVVKYIAPVLPPRSWPGLQEARRRGREGHEARARQAGRPLMPDGPGAGGLLTPRSTGRWCSATPRSGSPRGAPAQRLPGRPGPRTRCAAATWSSPARPPASGSPPPRALARLGAEVHLVVRNLDKGAGGRSDRAAGRAARPRELHLQPATSPTSTTYAASPSELAGERRRRSPGSCTTPARCRRSAPSRRRATSMTMACTCSARC